ncbi:hypothetical protein Bbelb_133130 [Branchiostoma belcheri]|nr:hypothetical protein Bbelb_133130 [Branchiostoma belcheri]
MSPTATSTTTTTSSVRTWCSIRNIRSFAERIRRAIATTAWTRGCSCTSAAAGWDLSHPFRGKGALMKGTFQLNKGHTPSLRNRPGQLGAPGRRQDQEATHYDAGDGYMEEQRRAEAEAKRQERKERLLRPRPPPTLPCDVLKILVGQEGEWMEEHACYFFRGAGGGGGTFVTRDDNTPLIIAGGGGSGSEMVHPECCFSDGTKETTGRNPSGRGVPVQSWPAYDGGGGGGLLTDGAGDFHTFKTFDGIMSGSNSGTAFVNGGKGGWGPCGGYGGFGGGGGGYGMIGGVGWGGGGGYSGGASGGEKGFVQCAGGGGSFNSGTETFGQSGANGGPGCELMGSPRHSTAPKTVPHERVSHLSRPTYGVGLPHLQLLSQAHHKRVSKESDKLGSRRSAPVSPVISARLPAGQRPCPRSSRPDFPPVSARVPGHLGPTSRRSAPVSPVISARLPAGQRPCPWSSRPDFPPVSARVPGHLGPTSRRSAPVSPVISARLSAGQRPCPRSSRPDSLVTSAGLAGSGPVRNTGRPKEPQWAAVQ